ncbi:MAG: sterol desaturase family protein [Proteobacteria bacterium]|nr:sterol desaturase family protein [Pseudomonadota bacterium]
MPGKSQTWMMIGDQMDQTTASYREAYRKRYIGRRYFGPAHFAFTFLVSAGVIAWCAAQLASVTAWEMAAIPLTFLYSNLVEYFGHRGPMHHPTKGLKGIYERHSRRHHRFFTNQEMAFDSSADFHAVLFPPVLVIFFTAVFALPVGLALGALASPNTAYLFVLTSLAYFLNYELLHFAYHLRLDHPLLRFSLLKTLRLLHLRHHQPALMSKYNFNITYPIGDWLFGTLYRPPASHG